MKWKTLRQFFTHKGTYQSRVSYPARINRSFSIFKDQFRICESHIFILWKEWNVSRVKGKDGQFKRAKTNPSEFNFAFDVWALTGYWSLDFQKGNNCQGCQLSPLVVILPLFSSHSSGFRSVNPTNPLVSEKFLNSTDGWIDFQAGEPTCLTQIYSLKG